MDFILTGHGPVIDTSIKEVIDRFRKNGEKYLVKNDTNKVTIVYASCYGYTKKMAEYLKEKFEKEGKKVAFYQIDALNYSTEKPLILEDIRTSGTVLFGTPTVLGDAISLFYDLLNSEPLMMFQNKKASVFGDYGWSGEGVGNLSLFLGIKKFKVVEGFKYSFKVDEEGYRKLDEYFMTIK